MNPVVALAVAIVLQVESAGGTDVRAGDNGRAVGPYQIHPCTVEEVNRIYKTNYKLADRNCPEKSRRICELTLLYHYNRGAKDPVTLACRWHRPYGKISPRYRRMVKKVHKEIIS